MFGTVLVANRGEIAVRVIRTLQRLGIRAVAVYSDVDAGAPHVRDADVAVRLGPAPAAQSYLAIERLLEAARSTGADAVHPGYGFLSENAAFAQACADAGITFVGPPPAAIEAMGDKIRAKETAVAAGAPIVPGVFRPGLGDAELLAAAGEVGFPLMVKASAGGGGKGMRVVHEPEALADALAAARREAKGAFGDDALMLERFVERPRHVEIQILADTHGSVLWVGERECSLQRRHQKVVEECPSPALDDDTRSRMGDAAVAIAKAVGYVGAGTVEFLTDSAAKEFFFLEVNTRLQVEHPVTEEVYGLDLVEQQLRVAAGERLAFTQDQLRPRGHAVEVRLYAEDPAHGFLPTGGEVLHFQAPPRPVRVDAGIATGSVVTSHYDPLLAKLITHAPTRREALTALRAGLERLVLLGFPTNAAFLHALLGDPDVAAGRLSTSLIEERLDTLIGDAQPPREVYAAVAAATLVRRRRHRTRGWVDPFAQPSSWRPGGPAWSTWRLRTAYTDPVVVRVRPVDDDIEIAVGDAPPERGSAALDHSGALTLTLAGATHRFVVEVDDERAWVASGARTWLLREEDLLAAGHSRSATTSGVVVSPMPGTVAVVAVAAGDQVTAGQTLAVVEAMKMEHPLVAPFDGTVAQLHVRAGQQVGMQEPVAEVAPQ